MNTNGNNGILLLIAILALIFFGGCCFSSGRKSGIYLATQDFRTEAVKRGFGEWKVADDGTTTFVWREVKP